MLHDIWKNEVDNMSEGDDNPVQLETVEADTSKHKRRASMLSDMVRDSLIKEDLLLDDEDDGEKRAQEFYNIMHGLNISAKRDIKGSSYQETVVKPSDAKKLQVTVTTSKSEALAELDEDTTDHKDEESTMKHDIDIVEDVASVVPPQVSKSSIETDVNDTKPDQKDKKGKRKPLPTAAPVPRTLKDDVRDLCITSASSRGISFRDLPTEPAPVGRYKKSSMKIVSSTSSRRSSISKSSVCLTSIEDVRSRVDESSSIVSQLTDSEHRSSIKVVACRRRSIEELAAPLSRRGSVVSLEPVSPPGTSHNANHGQRDGGDLDEIPPDFDVEHYSEEEEEFGLQIKPTRRHSSMKPRPSTPSLSNLLPKCSSERRLFYGPISMTTRGTVKVDFNRKQGKLRMRDSRFQTPVTSIKSYVNTHPRLATSASLHTAHRELIQLRPLPRPCFTPRLPTTRKPSVLRRPVTR